jgi:hypothetical protein
VTLCTELVQFWFWNSSLGLRDFYQKIRKLIYQLYRVWYDCEDEQTGPALLLVTKAYPFSSRVRFYTYDTLLLLLMGVVAWWLKCLPLKSGNCWSKLSLVYYYYFSLIVLQSTSLLKHFRIHFWNQPVLSNGRKVSCSQKQRLALVQAWFGDMTIFLHITWI